MIRLFILIYLLSGIINYSYCQDGSIEKIRNKAEQLEILLDFVETGDISYDIVAYKRKLILYLQKEKGMPVYENTSNRSGDRDVFMKNLKYWYQENPEYLDLLNMRTFEAFEKYDASCYPPPPDYSKFESEKDYLNSFRQWMAHHPEVPKLQGDDMASKEKFEREKAKFYELYFKK